MDESTEHNHVDVEANAEAEIERAPDATGGEQATAKEAAPEASVPAQASDGELPQDEGATEDAVTAEDSGERPAEPEPEAELETEPEAEPEPESEAKPEAEPEAVPEAEMSMMELLLQEGDYLPERHSRGDVIEGVVVAKEGGQLVVNIGAKQEGIVPASDLARLPREKAESIKVGDTVRAIVMRPEGRDNEVVVSISQALALTDWDRAKEMMESGEIQELEIVGFNKGGALVGFGFLQGFLPRSHMARGGDRGSPERMAEFVGQQVPIKIIEVNRRKRRLVMSERDAMRDWRADRKEQLMAELAVGDVRTGTVNAISDFGAFVDLGGADGLIHVSELSHDRTRHPRDVVKIGLEVEVVVLDIDRERRRIGLSMKRMQKNPWETVEQDHYIGELVDATIANLSDFGAFARLPDGLEGLIHISELADDHVEHPREAVRAGQTVTVEIIGIDPVRRRIGLSIRRVPEHLRRIVEPEPGAEPQPEPAAEPASDEPIADASREEPPGDGSDRAPADEPKEGVTEDEPAEALERDDAPSLDASSMASEDAFEDAPTDAAEAEPEGAEARDLVDDPGDLDAAETADASDALEADDPDEGQPADH